MAKINVTRCHLPDRARFDAYVDSIYESAWVTNNGPLVRELERRLEDYLGVRNLVLVANGTLALQIAYKLLDLQGEVITTPFTFIATASSIKWEGLDVVFADIDPVTLNLAPENIERAITDRTSAIVPVHVFGNPCDVEAIQEIANRHKLKVVYDAAHAFGVKYKDHSVLEWGDVSTLSFHATKLFHTIEGGALIIRDDALCAKARKMINFGITGRETIEELGINAKMNEYQAAMGLSMLDEMGSVIARRKKLVEIYDEVLASKLQGQRWVKGASRNFSYYPVLFDDEQVMLNVQRALNEKDVYPRRYFYPSLDDIGFLNNSGSARSVSGGVSRRALCLPLFSSLGADDARDIAGVIIEAADV